MDILQTLQEKYIQEFSQNTPLGEFLFNMLVTALLVGLLKWFYTRYGNSISNREKFAANFLPLALGTLLIITVVKSSIALSLGLVGALSIVRFRAAIKEPEELTYLLIVIGIGLAGGANQPVLAVIAFGVIIILLFVSRLLKGQKPLYKNNNMYVNISTDVRDITSISSILSGVFNYVELKRMETTDTGLDVSFICKAESVEQLNAVRKQLADLSESTQLSIIEQPEW